MSDHDNQCLNEDLAIVTLHASATCSAAGVPVEPRLAETCEESEIPAVSQEVEIKYKLACGQCVHLTGTGSSSHITKPVCEPLSTRLCGN